MKLAAIDIGTNSIHMVIVRVEDQRIFEIVDREKEMVFLGKKSLIDGKLAEDAMVRGLSAMIAFRQIAESHQVDEIIATATSAVREASNGRYFIKMIHDKTGIGVRVLSGKEEARMITLAVRDVIDLKDKRALIVDIGGGSMELIVADANHILFAESIKAGVIRLTERFMKHDPPQSADIKALQKWLYRKLEPITKKIQNLNPELMIGTSGTILALGEITHLQKKGSKGSAETLKLQDLAQLNEKTQSLTVEERVKLPGLDRNRADQIVAGGILVQSLMERCRANQLVLCDRALREGLIADYLIRRIPVSSARSIQARELRGKSILNLLDRWKIDRTHAEHTSKLAVQMFDALAPLHGYGPEERQMLEFATLLHDVGRVISYPGHHKHGWYIVKHANLIGFRPEEIEMLAAVVAYHRGKKPKANDQYSQNLSRKKRRIVKLLTALVRVCDGMDRQHNQSIVRVQATSESPDRLVITLYAQEPALIPLRAAAERADLLERMLDLKQIEFRSENIDATLADSNVSTVRVSHG